MFLFYTYCRFLFKLCFWDFYFKTQHLFRIMWNLIPTQILHMRSLKLLVLTLACFTCKSYSYILWNITILVAFGKKSIFILQFLYECVFLLFFQECIECCYTICEIVVGQSVNWIVNRDWSYSAVDYEFQSLENICCCSSIFRT